MGPLHGLKIVELAGIGPGPFAAMLLADLGATVLRIERTEPADLGIPRPAHLNPLLRNRERLALDLKQPQAVRQVLQLLETADGLIEGFRPGVAERLGLGPDACLRANPKLVYGRVTGWGQTGPLANAAGHDLNYIALTGALHAIGRAGQPPSIPLALVGDFGGGALYLAFGMLAAMMAVRAGGEGQVVDAAIVDGAASLATTFFGLKAAGLWNTERGTNILDSGAPFYEVYECRDGKWISVSAIEKRFFRELLQKLDLDPQAVGEQYDRAAWPRAKELLAQRFRQRTQREWCELLEGSDACFAPVLTFDEAPAHPHVQSRGVLIDVAGVVQPAPAPRFSRTVPPQPRAPEAEASRDFAEAYSRWTGG
ncbi:CaiB/BaiF CoA transferase family protein [Ramlibacter sp.]|uniref:CaiB/BaiF CoA transferase family protein n=1 Tax=Ramlibacter sp. TaxID=1917967 RepID=UPI002FC976E0